MKRQTYDLRKIDLSDGYGEITDSSWRPYPQSYNLGELVSSEIEGKDGHAPVFDIDVIVHLAPSKTEGHFHLYSPIPTTKRKYMKAIKALVDIGIVDPEWAKLTKKRGFGLVRRQPVEPELEYENIPYRWMDDDYAY